MKSYGTLTIPGPGTYRKDLTRPVARVGGPLAPPLSKKSWLRAWVDRLKM